MPKTSGTPVVHSVVDTNTVYTDAAHWLINKDLRDFIDNEARRLCLQIRWYLPTVVRSERKVQMVAAATKLSTQVTKLEALLGHSLGITAERLDLHIEVAIRREMERDLYTSLTH